MGHFVLTAFHLHVAQYLSDSLLAVFLIVPSGCLEYKLQVLVDITVCQQLEVLEYYAQFPAQWLKLFTLDGKDVIA